MKQRVSEWLEISDDYHERQWEKPYSSTIKFCDWLESLHVLNQNDSGKLLDVCCGAGANLYYMRKRYPKYIYKGIDINRDLIDWGNNKLREKAMTNVVLEVADLYEVPLGFKDEFDGIVMYQTLLGLPDYKAPIEKLISLNPRWIGLTSILYDGEVNSKIEIQDYTKPIYGKLFRESFYNIYSIRLIKELFDQHGYYKILFTPFEIDFDLPKPNHKGMGTYTERLENGRRIQISGPILMSWYFLLAIRL